MNDSELLKRVFWRRGRSSPLTSSSGDSSGDSADDVEEEVAASTSDYDRSLLFRPNRAEGVQEYEGQRVLQVRVGCVCLMRCDT